MFSLGVSIPQFHDVTSFYRAMGPLNHLRRQCANLNLVSMTQWNWASVGGCDAVFMQRPYTNDHRGVMEIAKGECIPVWVDYDDLLMDIPTDNPSFFLYMEPEIQANIKFIIESADVITASTEHLAKILRHLNKNVVVLNNAIDLRVFPYRRELPKRSRSIAWRGSKTHERDIFVFGEEIITAHRDERFKDWDWHFIGDNMWFVTDSMEHARTFVSKPVEVKKYHENLWKLAPTAVMVPLNQSHFNMCKSNIAWLEASFAGAACVAPAWAEWNKPGVQCYQDQKGFARCLEVILGDHLDCERAAATSWENILDCYTLDVVNPARIDVICSLMGIDRGDLGWRGTNRQGSRSPDSSASSGQRSPSSSMRLTVADAKNED